MKQIEIIREMEKPISAGHMSELVNGKARPSYSLAKELAKITSTDPVLWLEGTPDQIRAAISEQEAA